MAERYDPTGAAERLTAYRADVTSRMVAQVEWRERHPDINPHDPFAYTDELHAVDPYPSTLEALTIQRFLDVVSVALQVLRDAAHEIERLRAEVNSMASAQAGWGRVARLNDEIERLRAALAGHIIEPVPQEVLADIDSQLCDDCEPFTSVRIVERLREHGWRIVRVPHHDDPA